MRPGRNGLRADGWDRFRDSAAIELSHQCDRGTALQLVCGLAKWAALASCLAISTRLGGVGVGAKTGTPPGGAIVRPSRSRLWSTIGRFHAGTMRARAQFAPHRGLQASGVCRAGNAALLLLPAAGPVHAQAAQANWWESTPDTAPPTYRAPAGRARRTAPSAKLSRSTICAPIDTWRSDRCSLPWTPQSTATRISPAGRLAARAPGHDAKARTTSVPLRRRLRASGDLLPRADLQLLHV
jgi:hypothetical protein